MVTLYRYSVVSYMNGLDAIWHVIYLLYFCVLENRFTDMTLHVPNYYLSSTYGFCYTA